MRLALLTITRRVSHWHRLRSPQACVISGLPLLLPGTCVTSMPPGVCHIGTACGRHRHVPH